MANQKDDPAQSAKLLQSRKPTPATGTSDTGGERAAGVRADTEHSEHSSTQNSVNEKKASVSVGQRKQRYLIGLRSMPAFASAPREAFLDRLELMEGVQIVRKLRPRSAATHAPAAFASTLGMVVALIDEPRGEELRRHAPPDVIVEIDAPVSNSDLAALEPWGWQLRARAMPFPRSPRELRFTVIGGGDRPLANTSINLFGPGFPTQATTNAADMPRCKHSQRRRRTSKLCTCGRPQIIGSSTSRIRSSISIESM